MKCLSMPSKESLIFDYPCRGDLKVKFLLNHYKNNDLSETNRNYVFVIVTIGVFFSDVVFYLMI